MIIITPKINNFRQHIVMIWVYSILIVVYKIQISDQIHYYHSFVVVDTDVLDFRYLLNLQLFAHNFSFVLHAIQIVNIYFVIKSKSDQKCLVFVLCIILVNLHFLVPRYQYHLYFHGFRYIPSLKERAGMVNSNSAKNLRFLRVKCTLSSQLGFEIKLLQNIWHLSRQYIKFNNHFRVRVLDPSLGFTKELLSCSLSFFTNDERFQANFPSNMANLISEAVI